MTAHTLTLGQFGKALLPALNPQRSIPRLRALPGLVFARSHHKGGIAAQLEKAARKWGERPAVSFGGTATTYAQFNATANRFARTFASQGVKQGDCVAVMMENGPDILMVVAALSKIGAIAGLCNTNQRGDVLKHSLTTMSATYAVVDGACWGAFSAVSAVVSGTVFGVGNGHQGQDLHKLSSTQPDHNLPETAQRLLSDTAFYILTSGTTGLPKASRMSNLRWIKGGAGLGLGALGMNNTDVLYCTLPLYHNNALTVAWSSCVQSGACLLLTSKFSASRFWDDAIAGGATAFIYIGELCRYLMAQPAKRQDKQHRITKMLGNGLRAELWVPFKTRFNIPEVYEFYGASECNIGFTNLLNLEGTLGFCPLPYAIVKVDADSGEPLRDKKGFFTKVKKGESGLLIGEITDKTPYEGYTDARASEAKVLRNGFKKGDAWFNTGDLLRDMGFGHTQFVDRLGDTFRWKGENVATTELEEVADSFQQVEEAVAYGVEVPGAEGRCGMIAVKSTVPQALFDIAGFAAHLRAQLPAYAVPRFVRFLNDVQTTATFKYQKSDLKKDAYNPEKVGLVYVLAPNKAPAVLSDVASLEASSL